MAILKNRYFREFTQIPNLLINHVDLPDKAYRIIIYLMSKPHNWNVNNDDIMTKHKILTRGTMSKYWKVIIASGWISRVPAKKMKGKFRGFDYEINLYPYSPFPKPCINNQHTDKPCINKSDTEQDRTRPNDTLSNKDKNNTDFNSNTDFKKPSVKEVQDYMISKGVAENIAGVLAMQFCSFYKNNGWRVKKGSSMVKMTSWKGAASGWKNRSKVKDKDQFNGGFKNQGVKEL